MMQVDLAPNADLFQSLMSVLSILFQLKSNLTHIVIPALSDIRTTPAPLPQIL